MWVWSGRVTTAFGSDLKKLGQPVRLSNLAAELNSDRAQPAHTKTPFRSSLSSRLVKGYSVRPKRRMAKRSGPRRLSHSSGVWLTGKRWLSGTAMAPLPNSRIPAAAAPANRTNVRRSVTSFRRSFMAVSLGLSQVFDARVFLIMLTRLAPLSLAPGSCVATGGNLRSSVRAGMNRWSASVSGS